MSSVGPNSESTAAWYIGTTTNKKYFIFIFCLLQNNWVFVEMNVGELDSNGVPEPLALVNWFTINEVKKTSSYLVWRGDDQVWPTSIFVGETYLDWSCGEVART